MKWLCREQQGSFWPGSNPIGAVCPQYSVPTPQVVKYLDIIPAPSNLKFGLKKLSTRLSWLLKTRTCKLMNFGHVQEKQRSLV